MAAEAIAPTTRDIEPLMLRADVRPNSVDADARTFELVWTTGAGVRRYSWSKGEFIEELSLDPRHVRMGRLANRAPLLNSHNGWSLGGVLGVVEWARIEGSEGVAQVRFPSEGIDEEADRIFALVRDGILSHVSVGYRVYRYEITEEEGQLPIYRATDWEPYELSLVPMGADDKSTVRADQSADPNSCEFVLAHRGAEMAAEKKKGPQGGSTPAAATAATPETVARSSAPAPAPSVPAPDPEPTADEVRAAERERAAGIRKLVEGYGLGDDFIREMDELHNGRGATLDEARAIAFDRFYEAERKSPAGQIDNTVATGGRDLRREAAAEGVRNAILHRHDPLTHDLSDAGRMYRAMTVMEMCRAYLEARGQSTKGMTRNELARAALGLDTRAGEHSTSDFPFILADVATKELRKDYANAPQTFKAWASMGTIPDFKEISILQLGDFPTLDPVLEGGEYELGTIGEGREKMKLSKYGRRIAFTWEMLINDDLEAFMGLAARIGFAVANLESDVFYDDFTSNPTMGDGVALFNAAHDNVGTGALSVTSLSAGRAAMRKQKGLNGRRINIMAKYLLVPTDRETEAEQLTADLQPFQAGEVNPFSGKLTPLVEPRLDDASTLEWYLEASPAQVENYRYAYLRGETGPMVTSRIGFEVDCLEVKVKHVFAVKAIDHRGQYQSSGA